MSKRRRKWIECTPDTMPQDFYDKQLKDAAGNLYIGYWRPDAGKWDNDNTGWIKAEIVAWKNIPIEEDTYD